MGEKGEYKENDEDKEVGGDKIRDVGEQGEEEEHKYEEDGKGQNEAEIDEENLPLTQLVHLGTGAKGLVEGKKRIPLRFNILPYPHCGKFTISPFHHIIFSTISQVHH